MKRSKGHKIKREMPQTSTSTSKDQEEHDLAYYIHDRVELMHQVFSVLKYKELKAMAPACVRNISVDDLQELCTEELLGISSKRLCAILDGAEPPSDTESSDTSPEPELETISLDSISSDEEILSQGSGKKKKHKHKRHKIKSKRSRKSTESPDHQGKAARAGLTVLELLELQARARAIRAQLQQEQKKKTTSPSRAEGAAEQSAHSSDNEVEIKEEPPEVLEISSEDEKPDVQALERERNVQDEAASTTVTKRINDLVITVPQKPKQKIKLNRTKSVTATETTPNTKTIEQNNPTPKNTTATPKNSKETAKNTKDTTEKATKKDKDDKTTKDKGKKNKKQKKIITNEGSDNDEITLQLSDTEKMDLLEDLDRKNLDNVSSDSSSDSESDSDTNSDATDDDKPVNIPKKVKDKINKQVNTTKIEKTDLNNIKTDAIDTKNDCDDVSDVIDTSDNTIRSSNSPEKDTNASKTPEITGINPESDKMETGKESQINSKEDVSIKTVINDEIVTNNENFENTDNFDINTIEAHTMTQKVIHKLREDDSNVNNDTSKVIEIIDDTKNAEDNNSTLKEKDKQEDSLKGKPVEAKDVEKEMSEGEISEKGSSEIEAIDFKPEVVCISDEEDNKSKKKKKKKDKKAKKDKKSKKKDFRESADQNFYEERKIVENEPNESVKEQLKSICIPRERKDIQSICIPKDTQNSRHTDNAANSCDDSFTIDKIKNISITITNTNVANSNSSKTKDDAVINIEDGTDNKTSKTKDDPVIDLENDTDDKNTTTDKIATENTNTKSPQAEANEGSVINIEVEKDTDYKNETSDDSDVYEILELSDDSSCCEVEGTPSKEPTATEIEAISFEIDRVEVITEEEIREYEREQEKLQREVEEIENISWKDRYLDSKKVKKVLHTSNILNALRKKNKELKKKLEESKKEASNLKEDENIPEETPTEGNPVLEGSIDHYNTLQGSTKYVSPIEVTTQSKDVKVLGDLKKDAKQLLKMYKKLLKYNDMNKQKQKDPNRKKKKKKKERKVEVSTVVS